MKTVDIDITPDQLNKGVSLRMTYEILHDGKILSTATSVISIQSPKSLRFTEEGHKAAQDFRVKHTV